ncbi:hypothetical protein [Propionibacterium freudenreichii]|nr:hypothetical protein [Propionibacterium freudenreichii]
MSRSTTTHTLPACTQAWAPLLASGSVASLVTFCVIVPEKAPPVVVKGHE